MDHDFWHERWRQGSIGFHEGKPNTFLARHRRELKPGRVLVPLAGKSHDLVHLAAQGHEVVGVELSEIAVTSFFADHGLTPERATVGPYAAYSANGITLLCGDFFLLAPEHLGGPEAISGLYDRAAVVALPPELRRRYARHVRALMPVGSRGLVVTFDYAQELMDGPPFAVSGAELRALYEGLEVTEIDSAMADAPRLRAVGANAVERCFTIQF